MRLKLMMSGMVASPTPIVPISSDSTSVIETSFGSSRLESAAAVIQPGGAAAGNDDLLQARLHELISCSA